MRSSWESLREGLLQWLESREAAHSFDLLRVRAEELQTYAGPADLVEAIVHSSDLVGKDRVLKILIVARGSAALRRLSQALLILCLWPGLDFIFRRRIAVFRSPDELAAEIVGRFTEVVHRIDLPARHLRHRHAGSKHRSRRRRWAVPRGSDRTQLARFE